MLINGLHETWTIQHAEDAYGLARVGQSIVYAPDASMVRIYVDDEPLVVSAADLLGYERALDFREGVVRRSVQWWTSSGKQVLVDAVRCVSLADRHLGVEEVTIVLPEDEAPVVVLSQILNVQDCREQPTPILQEQMMDPRRAEQVFGRVFVPQAQVAEGETVMLGYQVARSGMTLVVGATHVMDTDNEWSVSTTVEEDVATVEYAVGAQPGKAIRVVKFFTYHSGQSDVPVSELLDRAGRTVQRAQLRGCGAVMEDQREWLAHFWRQADVEIEGDPGVQQVVRWNLFQLVQAAARAEDCGIAAKGVTGSGYSGHYFWDTEVYVMPFLSYTMPQLARNALRFRYLMLDKARERAAELDQKGALYPWRTINGQEASAYYAAGTAQYHIDADVSYAVVQYVQATGDEDFLFREAIDILVETACLWEDLGFHGVTGPDEYTAVVDDNLFTNVVARYNLRVAAQLVDRLAEHDGLLYSEMVQRLSLGEGEPERWRCAAERMFLPFDERLGIHPQDAHFLEREVWNKDKGKPKRPLLLHYHPLTIYRYQVIKQADVVLALFLRGSEFSEEEKRADFDYYDPLTTGDSSLSAVAQCIVAAELGYGHQAWEVFLQTLLVDVCDVHGNTADGVHIASCGGVWSALVCGFGGWRDYDGRWTIDPRLPEQWESLRYRLRLGESCLVVEVRSGMVRLSVETDSRVTVQVWGQSVTVDVGEDVVVRPQGV